jgi:hypothetical protein
MNNEMRVISPARGSEARHAVLWDVGEHFHKP